MKSFEKVDFNVKWLPFQLNPNASKEGVNKLQMYMQKFGRTREQTLMMSESMKERFASVGLPFKFTDKGVTGNTFNAHRLVSYAYAKGGASMQDKVMEELFLNYFGQEKFVNDPEVLVAAAVKGGIKEDEAKSFVEDESVHAKETQEELKHGQGIRGVPYFVIEANGQRARLSGAQETGAFVHTIEDLLSK